MKAVIIKKYGDESVVEIANLPKVKITSNEI